MPIMVIISVLNPLCIIPLKCCHVLDENLGCEGSLDLSKEVVYRGLDRTGAMGARHPQNFEVLYLVPVKF